MTRGPWEWSLTIKLAPGQYQYKYIEDNEWRHDQGKPTINDNMGNLNNIIMVEEKQDKETVEFISDGDAGIHRKTRMGTYIKTDQLARGRPVFEQAIQEKGGKKYFLFIGPDGCWRVGPDITSYSGSLLKHPKKTPDLPPKSGWHYYLNDKWNQDDSLKVIVNVKNVQGKTLAGSQTSRQPSQDVTAAIMDAIEADLDNLKSTGVLDDMTVDEYKEIFMEMDEDVNFDIGFFGQTPIMVAAGIGLAEVCKVLISAGADANKINTAWGVRETALIYAAQNGWPEICEILLSAGADINQMNHEGYGKTALDIAKENEKNRVVEVLEKHGASVSEFGLEQILEFHGISKSEIDKEDETGNTPLLYAAKLGNKDACKLLIKAGSDVNKVNKDNYEETALIEAADNGFKDICQILIEAGADIEKQDINGKTALMNTAYDGYADIAKMLISAGTDVNKRDVSGDTALYLASTFGHTEIVKILINAGAEIDATETDIQKGWTPLMKAAERGYTNICRLLVEAGAEIDKENDDGWTALLVAARNQCTEICTLLIKAGASIDKASKMHYDADWETEIHQYLADLGKELNIPN